MRWLASLLAAAACVALGTLAANRLTAREKALNAWEGALLRLEAVLAQGGGEVPALLRRAAGESVPLLLEAAQAMENTPALSPESMLDSLSWGTLLTPAEQDALRECLLGLFSPSPEMQRRAVAYAREQWALFRRLGREAAEKNTRLYQGLGWLAGAAVFILMC